MSVRETSGLTLCTAKEQKGLQTQQCQTVALGPWCLAQSLWTSPLTLHWKACGRSDNLLWDSTHNVGRWVASEQRPTLNL